MIVQEEKRQTLPSGIQRLYPLSTPHAQREAPTKLTHSVTQTMGPTWLQFEKTLRPIWWFHLFDWRALHRSEVLSQNRPAVGRRNATAVTGNKGNRWLNLQFARVDLDPRGLHVNSRPTTAGPQIQHLPPQDCFLASEIRGWSLLTSTC